MGLGTSKPATRTSSWRRSALTCGSAAVTRFCLRFFNGKVSSACLWQRGYFRLWRQGCVRLSWEVRLVRESLAAKLRPRVFGSNGASGCLWQRGCVCMSLARLARWRVCVQVRRRTSGHAACVAGHIGAFVA
eukprot:352233-Chlamydomonas_euryale.AAC.2